MYMYNIYADLAERKENPMTPFILITLSKKDYLQLPKDHVVAFKERDDTIREIFKIEEINTTPRHWVKG